MTYEIPAGEQTTRDWRAAWKRGADVIVWHVPNSVGVRALYVIRRRATRAKTIDVYDGRSTTPKRRRGVLVDLLYRTNNTVHYERTYLVLQSDGLPAVRKKERGSWAGGEPWTFDRQAEVGGVVTAEGRMRWFGGIELRDGTPWSVGADELIDAYGTTIDELDEIAAQNLPTGAYSFPRHRNARHGGLVVGREQAQIEHDLRTLPTAVYRNPRGRGRANRATVVSTETTMAKRKSRKKSKKMPAALRAHFAALAARKRPRVSLDGRKVTGKRASKVRRAVRGAVRRVSPRTKHGDVRFANAPTLSEVRAALSRAAKRGKAAFKKELARQKKIASRHVELDGKVTPAGKARMEVIRKVIAATGAKHGNVRWNNPHVFPSGRSLKVENIRGKRSAKALMKKAAAAKRKGRRFTGDVTRAGVHRTVKSASARLQGFTANRKANARSGGGAAFDPLRSVEMV